MDKEAHLLLRLVPSRLVSSKSQLVPFAVAAALLCVASATRADDWKTGTLEPRLQAILDSRDLRGADVGALAVDADSGAVLFAHEPDREMIPASNQKLLTALAAAAEFGPTHRFVTEVRAGAAPDAEGRVPWLAVRGSGDPTLTSEQWWRLAADLRRLGVRHVAGPVWFDASAFDSESWHPAWGQTSARAYHAPVAALSANYGAYAVVVVPGAAGEPARVRVDPPVPYLRVMNQARTGAEGSKATLTLSRKAGAGIERVIVTGSLAAGAEPEVFWRSVLDPVGYAASVFAMQLEANDIGVDGAVAAGVAPTSGVLLHEFEGKDMGEVLRLLGKYSSNVIAESLLKAMSARAFGGPGTFEGGAEAMRSRLEGLGLPLDHAKLVDGSGLARGNRVTPRLMVAALRTVRGSFEFGPEIVASLPIAGGDGTMSERAEGAAGRVRAKTGLLTGVATLSGYVQMANGRVAAFSFLVNDFEHGAPAARRAGDRFVEALAR